MENYEEKTKKINKINEGIFDKIFGKEKTIFNISQDSSGYILNKFRKKNIFESSIKYSTHLDLKDDDLWISGVYKWLYESVWNANQIDFGKNETNFSGQWYEGEFNGSDFWDSEGKSLFFDGFFNGKKYSAPNLTFKAPYQNFISGMFIDNENGILGGSNVGFEKYRNGEIDFINIPVGAYININKSLEFQVIKRLDEKNTDFIYFDTINGREINVEWNKIRMNYEKGVGKIRIGKAFNIAGFINIPKILSLDISTESSFKEYINFDLLSPDIKIGFYKADLLDSEEIENFKKFKSDLSNETIKNNFLLLKKMISNGKINGVGNQAYNEHLLKMFNGVIGNVLDARSEALMGYLDDFVQFLKYQFPKTVYDYMYKWIKNFLGIDKYIVKQQVKKSKPNQIIPPQPTKAVGKTKKGPPLA